MRIVLQRVRQASVLVEGVTVGAIEQGVVLLVGVERGDAEADVKAAVRKVAALRIFAGTTPMDRTLGHVGGACLVISQFTLAAVLAKGNRPGFGGAAAPVVAEALYEGVIARLRAVGLPVETGRFGATMVVRLENDGPVTLVIETRDGRVVDRRRDAS